MLEPTVEDIVEDLVVVLTHLPQVLICLKEHGDIDIALRDSFFKSAPLQAGFYSLCALLLHCKCRLLWFKV